jgi:uncharacterized cupin superfamily protein
VQTFNVFNGGDDWDSQNDRNGYRHKAVAFGKRLGADLIGGSLYEVPPGEKTWPYHYEQGCEEWLLVLSGQPTLRSPDGDQVLEPGDVAVFPEGPAGAHQVRNDTDELVRLIFFSSKSPLAIVHYPDSNKVGIWTEDEGYQALLRTDPKLDYWEGED